MVIAVDGGGNDEDRSPFIADGDYDASLKL
jgi:hypothetical protein